jgi:cysteine desulfurase
LADPAIYLDNNATTRLAPEALDAMFAYLRQAYGNPSSLHAFGRPVKEAIREARDGLAAFLSARPKDVVFTGGGTEADNLAILGVVGAAEAERRHLVTSTIEHHAVLHVMKDLGKHGYEVSFVDADQNGRVSAEALRAHLRPNTLLVSIMMANNETGVVQPIEELAECAHEVGAYFHTDAVQACGKIPVNVESLGVDLLSLSAHKFHGPKGVGALFVRRGTEFRAVFRGGGQERSRRPGTENVAGIVGLAEAARLAASHLAPASTRLTGLRDELEQRVLAAVPDSHVNGKPVPRTPNTSSLRFDGADGERIALTLDRAGFAVSTGAACAAGAVEPSHVLIAMGLTPTQVQGSIRVSLSRYTRSDEVEAFASALGEAVEGSRRRGSEAVAR